ncbi:MAG: hypothetical protein ACFFCW_24030 [Candidatus Hodarchaeota archaeon]
MPEAEKIIQDVLVDPLEQILLHVGRGIATAQMELDKNSLATQILIDNDEYLSQFGIEATWYHFPETTLELRMSLSMQWEEEKEEGKPVAWKRVLYAAPLNASYKNLFDYEAAGTSMIKTRIVSVPPATTIEAE